MEVTRTMPLNRHTMALSAKSVDAVKGRAGVKTDTVLRIEHLSKNFGSHIVLRDIDFSVRSGRGRLHHRRFRIGEVNDAALYQPFGNTNVRRDYL